MNWNKNCARKSEVKVPQLALLPTGPSPSDTSPNWHFPQLGIAPTKYFNSILIDRFTHRFKLLNSLNDIFWAFCLCHWEFWSHKLWAITAGTPEYSRFQSLIPIAVGTGDSILILHSRIEWDGYEWDSTNLAYIVGNKGKHLNYKTPNKYQAFFCALE